MWLWPSTKPTRIVGVGATWQRRDCKRLNEISVFRSYVRRNLRIPGLHETRLASKRRLRPRNGHFSRFSADSFRSYVRSDSNPVHPKTRTTESNHDAALTNAYCYPSKGMVCWSVSYSERVSRCKLSTSTPMLTRCSHSWHSTFRRGMRLSMSRYSAARNSSESGTAPVCWRNSTEPCGNGASRLVIRPTRRRVASTIGRAISITSCGNASACCGSDPSVVCTTVIGAEPAERTDVIRTMRCGDMDEVCALCVI